MIRRSFVLTAAALTLALGACDGGEDPAPAPSPSPSPSPSPTASPTYPALPLTAATEFFSISSATGYTGDLATGPVVLDAAGTDVRSDRVRLALSNNATTGTFVIREAFEESRFSATAPTPAPSPTPTSTPTYALVTPPSAAVTEYVFRIEDPGTPGRFAQGEFLNNTIPTLVTSDPDLALLRTSYAAWLRGDSTAGDHRITYTTFGYATVFSDMPTTGSATYSARIVGRIIRVNGTGPGTIERLGGTATFTINFATGFVTTTLTATAGGTPLGTFAGTGAIPVGSNQFSGSFGAASPIPGTFVGGFYGSQGAEIAINFALQGQVPGGPGVTLDARAVGVVVGKKN